MRDGRARPVAGARLHLSDLQRRRSRAPRRHPAPRPAAGQHAPLRDGHAQGHRLRHVALPRDRRARHHRHRQPAVHGARTVSWQGCVRQRCLLCRRDDVSDADRLAALRHAVAGRPRATDDAASCVTAAADQEPEDSESDQRHRAEGDGAGITARYQRAGDLLDDMLAAREPAPRRRRSPRRPATPTRTSPIFNHGSKPAKRRRHASAGTAASRFMRAPTSVRSAERSNRRWRAFQVPCSRFGVLLFQVRRSWFSVRGHRATAQLFGFFPRHDGSC